MKYTIPGENMKTAGKVIHLLAKMGEEVSLEPSEDSLTLRTVNLARWDSSLQDYISYLVSRSAFAHYNFGSSFFSSIEKDSELDDDDQADDNCKVNSPTRVTNFYIKGTIAALPGVCEEPPPGFQIPQHSWEDCGVVHSQHWSC